MRGIWHLTISPTLRWICLIGTFLVLYLRSMLTKQFFFNSWLEEKPMADGK